MTLLLATVACLPEAAMVQGALEQGSIHKEPELLVRISQKPTAMFAYCLFYPANKWKVKDV